MTPEEIGRTRLALQQEFGKLLGVKYKFGYEWRDRTKLPEFIDCSEAVEGVFALIGLEMPDGSTAQYNFTKPISGKPQVGDLGFFAYEKDPQKIYHVGMIYDAVNMVEARGFDKDAKFKTGEVILRPIAKWANYTDFAGFRAHPDLWVS